MEHVNFTTELSEKLAKDIITFCKEWGMWEAIQIFTGGKCYTDFLFRDEENFEEAEPGVYVRTETEPDRYLTGVTVTSNPCANEIEYSCYANPEHLLDMTYEGPLYMLIHNLEYEVNPHNLSDTAKEYICSHDKRIQDAIEYECIERADDYMENHSGWDPAEFDSYEAYLELEEPPEFNAEIFKHEPEEFSSREEYHEFLLKAECCKDASLEEYFFEQVKLETYQELAESEHYYNGGTIANHVLHEFGKIFERYGLWYEPGFSWSLTTYRQTYGKKRREVR